MAHPYRSLRVEHLAFGFLVAACSGNEAGTPDTTHADGSTVADATVMANPSSSDVEDSSAQPGQSDASGSSATDGATPSPETEDGDASGSDSDSGSASAPDSASTASAESAATATSASPSADAGACAFQEDAPLPVLASGPEPYSNAIAVSATGEVNAYRFDVSVESADIDCTQFTNWWEVLSESGELLYRRILSHSHTDENGTSDADSPGNTFTRDGGPVPVSETQVVLVRAHLSTGGYLGQVLRGSVACGFVPAPDIGSDFATDVETAAPQSESCDF